MSTQISPGLGKTGSVNVASQVLKRVVSKKKEKTMKLRMVIASLPVLAFTLAGVNQASAQRVTQNAPSGLIGWSTSAPLCTKVAGSAALAINYSAPSFVAFA